MLKTYRGRFAPSPTGPLHLGSLLAALGSYLQAKSQNGKWLVRIDDLDPPREMKGAADSILHTLDNFGLHWDDEVVYQSKHNELYENSLKKLASNGLLYQCNCSRKKIQSTAATGLLGYVYPKTCRDLSSHSVTNRPNASPAATRIKVDDVTLCFSDLLQGEVEHQLQKQIGDIVLRRADGLFAYHLAVVVDDFEQNITEIVRGIDLLDCTPIQIYLQQQLGYASNDNISYAHLPILVNTKNEKLSKQTKAEAVSETNIEETLFILLSYLNQNPPKELKQESKHNILTWAIKHWDIKRISGIKTIQVL